MKTVKTAKTVPAKVASKANGKTAAKNGNGKTAKPVKPAKESAGDVDATTAAIEKAAAAKSKERKVTMDDVKTGLAFLKAMPSYAVAKEVLALAHEVMQVEE